MWHLSPSGMLLLAGLLAVLTAVVVAWRRYRRHRRVTIRSARQVAAAVEAV